MKKNTVGNNLRRLREEMDLTQEALALKSDLTQGYINFLENGKRGFSRRSLEKISKSLGIPISKLFEEDVKEDSIGLAETLKEYHRDKSSYDEIIDLLDKLPKSVIKHYIMLLKAEIEIRDKKP